MRKDIIYLVMTGISGIMLLVSTILVLTMWQQIPDQIPMHFNIEGEVTNYGGKGTLIMLIVIAWVMFVGITLIMKFPNTWNLPVKITPENAGRIYGIARGMLEITKFIVILIMVVILLTIAYSVEFPRIIMAILVAALLVTVAGGTFLMARNK